MSDEITNTQDRPEGKSLAEQELQFYNLYVNGGLEHAGRLKKCFVGIFGESTIKNPYTSTNYLMDRPYVLAHIKTLLSLERLEMEMMTAKPQVAETLRTIMGETTTSDYTDHFGVPLSPTPLRAVSVNITKALMDIFPIRHKEENRLHIGGSGDNIIFNVIIPQNSMTDDEKGT